MVILIQEGETVAIGAVVGQIETAGVATNAAAVKLQKMVGGKNVVKTAKVKPSVTSNVYSQMYRKVPVWSRFVMHIHEERTVFVLQFARPKALE